MSKINIKLGDFVRSLFYVTQEIEIIKSCDVVFCGSVFNFLKSIEDSESVDSVYFVDKVLPVESSVGKIILVIYVREEEI